MLVAPATATTIAKAAHGLADTLLTALVLAHGPGVYFQPSMNHRVWESPAVRRNTATLRADGHHVLTPDPTAALTDGTPGAAVGPIPATPWPGSQGTPPVAPADPRSPSRDVARHRVGSPAPAVDRGTPAAPESTPVLALAGGAGSGKITIARELAAVVHLDLCYHRDPAAAPTVPSFDGTGPIVDFGHPHAIDARRVEAEIARHDEAALVIVEGRSPSPRPVSAIAPTGARTSTRKPTSASPARPSARSRNAKTPGSRCAATSNEAATPTNYTWRPPASSRTWFLTEPAPSTPSCNTSWTSWPSTQPAPRAPRATPASSHRGDLAGTDTLLDMLRLVPARRRRPEPTVGPHRERAVRPPTLTGVVDFGATPEGAPVLAGLRSLPDLLGRKKVAASEIDLSLLSGSWRRLVLSAPGVEPGCVEWKAYVFCVLEHFHWMLRRREIFARNSSKWGDPRAKLLSGAAWTRTRPTVLASLGLPEDAQEQLRARAELLDGTYREVASRLPVNTQATFGEDGRLHLAALEPEPDPPSLVELRAAVKSMMPRVDLPEAILEVFSWTGADRAFTSITGSESRLADLRITIAALLVAHGCNVGYTPVIGGADTLTRDRLGHVDHNYLRLATYRAANATMIDYQAGIDLAQAWGGGLVASVDGMRFVAPVPSVYARPNPRFFGRRGGATWLNMINDQAAGLGGKVVAGTPRDSLYVLDVLYDREGGKLPEMIVTDTASYSDIVFGLLTLAGYVYAPQLADLPDQKMWRVDARAHYGPFQQVARGRVDPVRIERHWDDILRIIGSIHTGAVRVRRHPDALARRPAHPAGRRDRALRPDLQVPAHPATRGRARLPATDQGPGQPPGGPALPRPEDLPRQGRTALPELPGRHGGPTRRARPGPQRPGALQHPLHGRRRQAVADRRLRRPRRGRGPPVPVRTRPREHARAILLRPARTPQRIEAVARAERRSRMTAPTRP